MNNSPLMGLGAILLYLGVPIAIIVIIFKLKEKNEKEKQMASRQAYEKEKTERIEAERKEKELARNGISVTRDAMTSKYIDKAPTIKAAERFADEFIKKIKEADRDIRKKMIECSFEVGAIIEKEEGAICTKIGEVSAMAASGSYAFFYNTDMYTSCGDFINFEAENLRPLQGRDETVAFVRAVALKAYDIINKKYIKDETGTSYQITMKEFSGNSINRISYGISIKFEYTAKNGHYSAPAEW